MRTTKKVVDSACKLAYDDKKRINWKEIYGGEKAKQKYNIFLPNETLENIKKYRIALKSPLTTLIASGYRSLNEGEIIKNMMKK